MPVRKIPKNHLVVTGSFASRKNDQMDGFESLLEKEYMLLLDFDEHVERFEAQPVTIPVPGIPKGYTPDVLVYFRTNPNSGDIRKPLLTEVKHTDDLKRNAEKYASKFAAAEQYALENNWEFRVTTQNDIRIPRLANIKFLREYRNIEPSAEDTARLIRLAKNLGGTATPAALLEQLVVNVDDQLHWLPVIWHSILTRELIADLDKPLDHETILRLRQDIL
ncbi:TnsA endonuclease N-terminal domain-containing protein [Undibacterium sp. Ji22W]|uniref:TnsA endonuclease N-terminal domain-containing protein n=1 Tax=Undibacterium sp. Ji22W TaxID=3413038 RepID=UPI003BF0CA82